MKNVGRGPTHLRENIMPKITLIVTPKKCPKCFQCEDLVARLLEHFAGQLEFVELDTTAEEVQQFGVVLPPMLLIDDFIAAAGKVPIYDALVKLITAKLAKES
jgi:hypothetical protein